MKRFASLLIVFVLLLTAGCERYNTYEYTESYLRATEEFGADFLFNGNVPQAVVGGHTYQFGKDISEKERNIFITNQEKICTYLENQNISTQGLTFRILKSYCNRTESENGVAYYNLTTKLSWEQVLTTLQVCYGDYTNYGFLYALGNYVAGQLKGSRETVITPQNWVFKAQPSLLNLVYPCFVDRYNPSGVNSCKMLAVQLLAKQENIWSEEEFLKQREAYAQKEGIDFEPTYLTFAYNGQTCPLKMDSRYLEVYFDSTFTYSNQYLDGRIPEDYTADVEGLIHTFTWLDAQLTDACSRLGADPQDKLPVQMMAALPDGYASPYFETGGLYCVYGAEKKIFATTVTVLAHEYLHHIYKILGGPDDPTYQSWYNECIAYYFTVGHQYEDRINVIKYVDPSYSQQLEEKLGEPYDEYADAIKLLRIITREGQWQYQYYLKTENALCCTFGEYFVRTYGEEAFVNAMLHASKVKEITGKTMNEIVTDWEEDMKDPTKDALVQFG